MPPQQAYGLLDVVDDIQGFIAHFVVFVLSARWGRA
jgi:hypothetical protein